MLYIYTELHSHLFLIVIVLPIRRSEIISMHFFLCTARLVNVSNIFMKIGHLFLIIVVHVRTLNYQFL